jgi:hypothetical protein
MTILCKHLNEPNVVFIWDVLPCNLMDRRLLFGCDSSLDPAYSRNRFLRRCSNLGRAETLTAVRDSNSKFVNHHVPQRREIALDIA